MPHWKHTNGMGKQSIAQRIQGFSLSIVSSLSLLLSLVTASARSARKTRREISGVKVRGKSEEVWIFFFFSENVTTVVTLWPSTGYQQFVNSRTQFGTCIHLVLATVMKALDLSIVFSNIVFQYRPDYTSMPTSHRLLQ